MPNDIPGINKYEQKLIRNFLSTTAALYYRIRSYNIQQTEPNTDTDKWTDAVNALMQQTESNTEGWQDWEEEDAEEELEINPEQPYGSSLWSLFMEGWHHGRQGCGLTFCGCSNGEIARDEHGLEVVSVYQQEGATDDVDEPNPQSPA